MELVEWQESFSGGHILMDTHHRIFFEMVKEFSGQTDKSGFDELKKRIDFLVEYTSMHHSA